MRIIYNFKVTHVTYYCIFNILFTINLLTCFVCAFVIFFDYLLRYLIFA